MKLAKKLLPLLCAVLLCGCADTAVPTQSTPAPTPELSQPPTPTPTPTPEPIALPVLSDSESERMANYMSANRALLDGDVLYTFDFDESFSPVLAKYELGKKTVKRTELVKDCVPECLTLHEGRLYFVSDGAVQSVRTDGKELKTLVGDVSGDMRICGGALWYRDGQGRFCRADIDGKNAEVIIDKLCYYPYVIGDTVLYQDDADAERLHIYSLTQQRDQRVTEVPVYEYVIIGDTLYFTTCTEKGLCSARANADGTVELFEDCDGSVCSRFGGAWSICGVALDRLGRDKPAAAQLDGYEICEFTSEAYEVRTRYNPDSRIREFVLYTADGEWTYIGPIQ